MSAAIRLIIKKICIHIFTYRLIRAFFLKKNPSPLLVVQKFRDTDTMAKLVKFYEDANADLDKILAESNVKII